MGLRRPETMWRLVEARCSQLADAVAAARLPFLLGLTWTFVWGWGLYGAEFGYMNLYSARYESFIKLSRSPDAASQEKFRSICCHILPAHEGSTCTPSTLTRREVGECRKRVKERAAWANVAARETHFVAFPGGLGKTTVSDLGIVGQAGMLLILTWTYYAARRENHAIRALVDVDSDTRRQRRWFPRQFTLVPQDQGLSAEHLAYAYHAIAQRFMFLFSTHSRPLLGATIVLCCAPAVVATWNCATDLRDCLDGWDFFERAVFIRTGIAFLLLALVTYVSLRIIRFAMDTSVVLNGWHLASRDVWMDEWDETTVDRASDVEVDAERQRARRSHARARPRALVNSPTQPSIAN